jgi:hypothetical protein
VGTLSDILSAFAAVGWRVEFQQAVSGKAANPTRVDFAHGRARLRLLVYAWRITGEGAGRRGDNFRIQTTRSHTGDLLTEAGRLTVGIGLDQARGVIAVFDGWTKRATGGSSSVHIKRALLDEAESEGFAIQSPIWDARAAARLDRVADLLDWMLGQQAVRTAPVQPVAWTVSGEQVEVSADLWASAPAAWLRASDNLILVNDGGDELLDTGLWRIDDVEVAVVNKGSRYPRRAVTFHGHRVGYVKKPEQVLHGLKSGTQND